jgi:hypothetical protein
MKKLLTALVILSAPAHAQAPTPTAYYWQVADTSPTMFVWETTSGAFVANTSAAYQAWLTQQSQLSPAIAPAATVCGVNNNSFTVQLKLCNPTLMGGWATGQIKTVFGVGGVPGANGTFPITVDDISNGLVSLQGAGYSGAWTSGGIIGAAPTMTTSVQLWAVIDKYNRAFYAAEQGCLYAFLAGCSVDRNLSVTGSPPSCTGSGPSTCTLVNPAYPVYFLGALGATTAIYLPQANLFGSPPLGMPIVFFNGSGVAGTIYDHGGPGGMPAPAPLVTFTSSQTVTVYLYDNGSPYGSWAYSIGTH